MTYGRILLYLFQLIYRNDNLMKWIRQFRDWWYREQRAELDFYDQVDHDPRRRAMTKKYRSRPTDYGYIDATNETEENNGKKI